VSKCTTEWNEAKHSEQRHNMRGGNNNAVEMQWKEAKVT